MTSNLPDVQSLVVSLSRRYDEEEVSVLADWFEERQIEGLAADLRECLEDPQRLTGHLWVMSRILSTSGWAYKSHASWVRESFRARGLCGQVARDKFLACGRSSEVCGSRRQHQMITMAEMLESAKYIDGRK